jgi:hypothetical protein
MNSYKNFKIFNYKQINLQIVNKKFFILAKNICIKEFY